MLHMPPLTLHRCVTKIDSFFGMSFSSQQRIPCSANSCQACSEPADAATKIADHTTAFMDSSTNAPTVQSCSLRKSTNTALLNAPKKLAVSAALKCAV
jgi:hypothetical protein